MTPYQEALGKLPGKAQQLVEDALTSWSKDRDLGPVAQNIRDETALATSDFSDLLSDFATSLGAVKGQVDSWKTACRNEKLKGHRIPDEKCPAILGRVRKVEDHASAVAKTSQGRRNFTQGEVARLLRLYAGRHVPVGLEAFLRDTPLGDFPVWATFDPSNMSADPFNRLGKTHARICTALGLGHYTQHDTLILLVWNHATSGGIPLHRPTVADAEDNPYYKPHSNPNEPYGLTQPLSPNPANLPPQPEVVSKPTSGKGLRLPFEIVRA